jgi:hypothetical protein
MAGFSRLTAMRLLLTVALVGGLGGGYGDR